MNEEQQQKNGQIYNISKLAATLLSFASLLIIAFMIPSTLVDNTIATEIAFAQQQTPTEIISTVKTILNQTINEYKNQNFTGAQNLASSAYLDHFEFIEAPLEKHDKTLKENTEIMLREQLRQSISKVRTNNNIINYITNCHSLD